MSKSAIRDRLNGEAWVALPYALLSDPGVSAQAKIVWAVLHSHLKPRGHGIFPLRETIAAECGGCSVATVKRAVSELKAAGWLKVKQRRNKTGNLGVNEYTLRVPRVTDDPRSRVTNDPPPRVTDDSPEVEEVVSRDVRSNERNRAPASPGAVRDTIEKALAR